MVSVSPPFHPGRSDFPSPVGDHGFPQAAFPIQRKLKCRLTYTPHRERCTTISVAKRVGEIFDMPTRDLIAPGEQPHRVKARSFLAYRAIHELGMSVTDMGLKLGLSQSTAGRAVQRRRGIADASGVNWRSPKTHGHPLWPPTTAEVGPFASPFTVVSTPPKKNYPPLRERTANPRTPPE